MDDTDAPGRADGPDILALEHFLPYRLSVATNRVSRALARVYERRFDLSVPEWRVMATLGRFPGLSAGQVAERTAMDKVAVSRAVARLLSRGRLQREMAQQDRRRSALRLSADGMAVYRQIVPLAQAYERELRRALGPAHEAALGEALARLQAAAERLAAGMMEPPAAAPAE